MSKKKLILNESVTRRFMRLAEIENNLADQFLTELGEEEQEMELEILAAEIEAEAIQMKLDYEQNPSEESGSVVVIHQESEFLDEEE